MIKAISDEVVYPKTSFRQTFYGKKPENTPDLAVILLILQGLRTKIIEHPEHDERKRLSKAHDVAFLTPMKKE